MKPRATAASAVRDDTRESATARPPIAPPAKAIRDSRIVHRAAMRMNRNSLVPNWRSIRFSSTPVRIRERQTVDGGEQAGERHRQEEIDERYDEIDLEARER